MSESVEFLTSPTLLEQICAYETGVGYRDQVAWQRFIAKYRPYPLVPAAGRSGTIGAPVSAGPAISDRWGKRNWRAG